MKTPENDWSSPHGTYPPKGLARWLSGFARALPDNRLGREGARVLRRFAMPLVKGPVDLSVDGLKLRSILAENQAEKAIFFMPGGYERREMAALVRLIPPDGVFLDIGANVGVYTATLVRHLSEAGRIIAIEANPAIIERLDFNIEANRNPDVPGPTVTVLNVGVSDVEATVDMVVHQDDLGRSRLGGFADKHASPAERSLQVRCAPLIDILRENAVGAVDAIKVDVEGAEDRVLIPYLEGTDEHQRARWILIEENPHLWSRDLLATLRSFGYEEIGRFRKNTLFGRKRP